jgi:hypothetical protein
MKNQKKNYPICMRIFLIFSLLSLAACNHAAKVKNTLTTAREDSKIHKIILKDSLGSITLSLPIRYDTSFTWIHYSDCGKPCEKRKYRFQSKTLPVYPETGYIYKPLNDSIDQFTIIHNPYLDAGYFDNPDNKSSIISIHDHKKWDIIHDPDLLNIKWDTIEKIGDRYFSIILIDKYDTARAQYSKKLLSTTTIKNGTIDFNFELLTKQKDSITDKFIDNAKYYLRTIRFGVSNK